MKTVSLEMARLLKEEGFRQDTEFYWCELGTPSGIESFLKWHGNMDEYIHRHTRNKLAAPTSDELLDELPSEISYQKNLWVLHVRKNKDSFGVSYQTITTKIVDHFIKGKSWEYTWDYVYATCKEESSEALASLYLWLKQGGLLKETK